MQTGRRSGYANKSSGFHPRVFGFRQRTRLRVARILCFGGQSFSNEPPFPLRSSHTFSFSSFDHLSRRSSRLSYILDRNKSSLRLFSLEPFFRRPIAKRRTNVLSRCSQSLPKSLAIFIQASPIRRTTDLYDSESPGALLVAFESKSILFNYLA